MKQVQISEMVKARREYHSEWRKKNKDRVRKYNENYWKKRAEQKLKAGEANANNTNYENY